MVPRGAPPTRVDSLVVYGLLPGLRTGTRDAAISSRIETAVAEEIQRSQVFSMNELK